MKSVQVENTERRKSRVEIPSLFLFQTRPTNFALSSFFMVSIARRRRPFVIADDKFDGFALISALLPTLRCGAGGVAIISTSWIFAGTPTEKLPDANYKHGATKRNGIREKCQHIIVQLGSSLFFLFFPRAREHLQYASETCVRQFASRFVIAWEITHIRIDHFSSTLQDRYMCV